MRRELHGKRAIVTGASSGIGRALAIALGHAGAKVALTARSESKLRAVASEITAAETLVVPADVTKDGDRCRLIETVVARWGGLDLFCNVAGIASWGHFASSTEAVNRQILETNFFAPVELIRGAVPSLTQGNQPVIVNVTSMTGRRGMPAWPEYSASKFALVGFSEALRGEMARFGIDVITIVPGLTRTNLQNQMLRSEGRVKIDFDKGMPPERVADKILHAIRKNRTERVLGWEARLMLFLNRWTPRLLDRLIARRVTQEYKTNS